MNPNEDDFIIRCGLLRKKLIKVADSEGCPKVWASVLIELLRSVAYEQSDPRACLEITAKALLRDYE